jgi:hypothetical protein
MTKLVPIIASVSYCSWSRGESVITYGQGRSDGQRQTNISTHVNEVLDDSHNVPRRTCLLPCSFLQAQSSRPARA